MRWVPSTEETNAKRLYTSDPGTAREVSERAWSIRPSQMEDETSAGRGHRLRNRRLPAVAVVDHRGEILCRNGTNTQRLTGSSEDWCLTFADAEYRRRCRLASSGTPARLAARSKRLSPGGGTGGFSAHTLQAGCPLHAVDFLRDSREYSGGVEEHPQHAFFRVFPPLHLPTHRSGKCLSPACGGLPLRWPPQ